MTFPNIDCIHYHSDAECGLYKNHCVAVHGIHCSEQKSITGQQIANQNPVEFSFEEMVSALVKPGKEIIYELTPEQADLWHVATGVSGEAGELLDAIKKHVIYGKNLDRMNVIEELGDLDFYMERIRQIIGVTQQDCRNANMNKLGERYPGFSYSNQSAIKRADKTEDTSNG